MLKKDFLIGFSLAGFQAEMGSGQGDQNSDWWRWTTNEDNIKCGLVSGDSPADGMDYWNLYEKYNKKAGEMGLNAARMGIEWTRLFPKASESVKVNVEMAKDDLVGIEINDSTMEKMDSIVDKESLKRYTEMFQNIKDNGMKLIINAYHWPLPLILHDPIESRSSGAHNVASGWVNRKTAIEFTKYAAYVSWKFSDMVEQFSIMNEPNVVYGNGYLNVKSGFPPSYPSPKAAALSKKHIIEAIGRSYDAMKLYTKKPVGFIYANTDFQPLAPEDEEATELAKYDQRYSFIDALHTGDMKWFVDANKAGILDEETSAKRNDLKGRVDWLGVNYYTRTVIKKNGDEYKALPGYGHAATAGMLSLGGREVSDFGWEIYPKGLYNVLKEYNDRYNLPLIVTENGLADEKDRFRSRYLVSHLAQVEKAQEDGIDVRGYLHWSLYDNYEWSSGFRMKFGLIGIDRKTKELEIRPSALVYEKIAKSGQIPDELRWMAEE